MPRERVPTDRRDAGVVNIARNRNNRFRLRSSTRSTLTTTSQRSGDDDMLRHHKATVSVKEQTNGNSTVHDTPNERLSQCDTATLMQSVWPRAVEAEATAHALTPVRTAARH
jgi:hypothetical protein